MAIVQYAAPISAIRGSIGGWTFQTNRAGNIVRLRPKGLKSPSNKQSVSIATQIQLISDFNELTPGQKEDWNEFALVNTHQDRFGTTRILTGQNWFISVNRNRLLLNLGILNAPPLALLPNGNANFSLVIDNTKIEIIKTAPTDPADTAFKIFTTPPLGRSTNSLQSSLRLTKIIPSGPFTNFDLTGDWIIAHSCTWPPGPAPNRFTIGVQLQLVRKTSGITTAGNTQIDGLVDPPIGVGFWIIETDFVVG